MQLIEQIRNLKKEKNAIILAHNYQVPEIYEIADFIGDSFELGKKAMETKADIIVFAGVRFMAEMAKLLNPDKKVILPNIQAGCPMADMITPKKIKELQKKHPQASTVCYVNTTAETKALCDITVTSANALEICQKIETEEIIFLPDQHLGNFIQQKLPHKKMIIFDGFCHVHAKFNEKYFKKTIEKNSDAIVIIHPEMPKGFYKFADFILGTGGMVKHIKASSEKRFIIGTENGMCYRLKKDFPDKEFIPVLGICVNMKKITLENIKQSLEEEKNEIIINQDIFEKARKPLLRMMEYST